MGSLADWRDVSLSLEERPGAWLESVLREGQASLLDFVPKGEEVLPPDVIARQERWLARRARFEARRAPCGEDMALMADLEREVPTGRMLRRALGDGGVQMSGSAEGEEDVVQMSGGAEGAPRATATLRLRMREETALHFRQLEEAHGRRLSVHGPANDLCWELGRVPALVVEGRRKVVA